MVLVFNLVTKLSFGIQSIQYIILHDCTPSLCSPIVILLRKPTELILALQSYLNFVTSIEESLVV